MFKIVLTFVTLIVASLGFGQEASVNLRMTIWSGSEEHLALLNGFADAYKEEHPNVSVQFDVIPFGDYVQKVTIQLAGGNPPDLGWLAEASAPAFIDAGVLEDFGPAVREDTDYDFADFFRTRDAALGRRRCSVRHSFFHLAVYHLFQP